MALYPCVGASRAGSPSWLGSASPPSPNFGSLNCFLPFYRAVTSVISATANVTAAEGGIMDLGSVCNS